MELVWERLREVVSALFPESEDSVMDTIPLCAMSEILAKVVLYPGRTVYSRKRTHPDTANHGYLGKRPCFCGQSRDAKVSSGCVRSSCTSRPVFELNVHAS